MAFTLEAYDGEGRSLAGGQALQEFFTSDNYYGDIFNNAQSSFNSETSQENQKIQSWNFASNADGVARTGTTSGLAPRTTYESLISWASYYSDEYRFKFLNQDGRPVLSEDGEAIFDNLIRFAFVDFSYIDESKAPQNVRNSKTFSYSTTDPDKHFKRQNPQSHMILLMEPEPLDYYYAPGGPSGTFKKEKAKKNRLYLYLLNAQNSIEVLEIVMKSTYAQESRGGGGQMRADPVAEVEYIWAGNKAIGLAIGLEADNYQRSIMSKLAFDIHSKTKGYQPSALPSGDFPNLSTPPQNTISSQVWYAKRFTTPTTKRNLPKGVPAPTSSVHSLPNKRIIKNANAPVTDSDIRHILFSIKNEKNLFRPRSKRADAGSVMGDSLNLFQGFRTDYASWVQEKGENISTAKVSATHFTRFMLDKINGLKDDQWKAHKELNWSGVSQKPNDWLNLRTEQEWCHLIGHGDGGREAVGNFVAGSKHCNTTQLAIETAQRQNEYKNQGLSLKVTAYLFENIFFQEEDITKEGVEDVIKMARDPDKSVSGSKRRAASKTPINSPLELGRILLEDNTIDNAVRRQVVNNFLFVLPLARFIRYRIFRNGSKLFDFSYDAQSESFDYNEFRILETTVDRALSQALHGNLDQYKKKVKEKLAKRFPDEAEGNIDQLVSGISGPASPMTRVTASGAGNRQGRFNL